MAYFALDVGGMMTNIDPPWLPEVILIIEVVSEVFEPRIDTLCSFPLILTNMAL